MMNHILQLKGQSETSGMLGFIGHVWYAIVHLCGTVPVERGLFFAHSEVKKNPSGQTVGGGS